MYNATTAARQNTKNKVMYILIYIYEEPTHISNIYCVIFGCFEYFLYFCSANIKKALTIAYSYNDKTNRIIMTKQQVYNLKDFALRHHLPDIFGAYAAHVAFDGSQNEALVRLTADRTLFTKVLLVTSGILQMEVLQQTGAADEGKRQLKASDLLVLSPKHTIAFTETSPDFEVECILVDEEIAADVVYHLSDDKQKATLDIFHMIRDIVRHQHIYKVEMIQSMVNVLKLLVSELPYENLTVTHDLKHKKDVYEIFLHLLYRNFKSERQIRFYADKLNISTAYLSRIVKEISGTTVNDHITSLLYKEICNLLKQSDMTMGEIADHLHFSDQSAMSNFFKQRAGMSPLAYRNIT